MKVLLSSKVLAKELSQIDFENSVVHTVLIKNNELILVTSTNRIAIPVHVILESSYMIDQSNRRWQCIYDVVKIIKDQPIVLNILQNKITITIED